MGWGNLVERDSSAYNTAALNILKSGVPRTRSGAVHMHAPIYCCFLALCYGIGGQNLVSVAVPQAMMAGLTCFLVGLVAGRIAPQRKTAATLITTLLYLVNLRAAPRMTCSNWTAELSGKTTIRILKACG